MKTPSIRPVRCAIYTRVSTEHGLGVPTIKGGGIEPTLEHREAVRNEAIAKVKEALEKAGIEFLPERGGSVGLRGRIE